MELDLEPSRAVHDIPQQDQIWSEGETMLVELQSAHEIAAAEVALE